MAEYRRNDQRRYKSDGLTGTKLVGIALAAVAALAVMLWAMGGRDQRPNTANPSKVTETPRPGSAPQSNPGPSDRAPATTPKAQ